MLKKINGGFAVLVSATLAALISLGLGGDWCKQRNIVRRGTRLGPIPIGA
jgi:hypothetical protein